MTSNATITNRFRFAPSPTGQVHIGNIRTAIFNYLAARSSNSEFIVRVEDTDIERSTQDAIDKLFESMKWLELDYDGDLFYQTKHADEHIAAAEKLLSEKKAYKPANKPEGTPLPIIFQIPWDSDNNPNVKIGDNVELIVHPEEKVIISSEGINYAQVSKKGKPIPCAATIAGFHELVIYNENGDSIFEIEKNIDEILNKNSIFEFTGCAKFAFQRREIQFEDIVKGKLSKPLDTMKDLVIVRADGTPIFHLANVCDDALQKVSCVVRGDDHVENTYRHVLLLQALEYDIPKYAHLPMIVNQAGKPYSKRDGDAFVGDFQKKGFLAEALFNYLALLGWSPGDNREKLSKQELIEAFTLERVISSPAKFDFVKLTNINSMYIADLTEDEFIDTIANFATITNRNEISDLIKNNSANFAKVAELMQVRTKVLSDVDSWLLFFADKIEYDQKAFRKAIIKPDLIETLQKLTNSFDSIVDFNADEIEKAVRAFEASESLHEGSLNRPLRVAVTGSGSGADLMKTLEIIGKDKVIERLINLSN